MVQRNWLFANATALAMLGTALGPGPAASQTCNTLLGSADCAARTTIAPAGERSASSTFSGPTALSTQALGRGFSAATEQTGMFGALTFGGAGTTCSGPFRVRRC